ncbi:hypothetical protein ACFL2D_03100 [Patescibacteria group bacterium]
MNEIERMQDELKGIQERNSRVEEDKAWETSLARKTLLFVITYGLAVLLLYIIGAENYFLGALVPALGFVLSVQTLPFLKKWWVQNRYRKNERKA